MSSTRRRSFITTTTRHYREVSLDDRHCHRRKSINFAFANCNFVLNAGIDYHPDSEVHITAPITRYEPQIYYPTQHSHSLSKSQTYARLNKRLVDLKRQKMFVERIYRQYDSRLTGSYSAMSQDLGEFADLLKGMDGDVSRLEGILRRMRSKLASGILGWDGEEARPPSWEESGPECFEGGKRLCGIAMAQNCLLSNDGGIAHGPQPRHAEERRHRTPKSLQ